MLVKNENLELVDISTYANEIINEGLGENNVTEQDAIDALAKLYLNYAQTQPNLFLIDRSDAFATFSVENIDKVNLWEELRKIFCTIANTDSVFSKVVEFVLEAIAQIIPLGVFIKSLVKIIIKYFLQWGVGKICPN
jgi:hypothetical protein